MSYTPGTEKPYRILPHVDFFVLFFWVFSLSVTVRMTDAHMTLMVHGSWYSYVVSHIPYYSSTVSGAWYQFDIPYDTVLQYPLC